MTTKCGVCSVGILEAKSRTRSISYDDAILNVEERLFECNNCQAQPSTTKLIKEHRQAIRLAKYNHDKTKHPLS